MTDLEQPINFLLVDDLEENLVALEALLQRDGLTCLKARSGEEALELLLVHDIALALLDVQMPGMDGFELAEFMRGGDRTRHVPIIFVTAGSADARRRFRGYEAGAVDFIQKPIEPDILRSKAAVFFDLHQQRRQILAQRDALETQAAALRNADRRKNEFLAVLGHELRNPVMALRAGVQLLARQDDADKAAAIRTRMDTQVLHLSRLIEDLLDISRIDQGKITLSLDRVPLQAVLDSAVDIVRHKVEAGRHTLTVEAPDEAVWLTGDFTRLAQVVSNLLGNAAKYTPPGGEIRLTARLGTDTVEIEVADNGIGVPPDMQSRIFDLFTQVQGPDARSRDGLGIGLALVKQLVELHGGSIGLRSEGPNLGSAFIVRFPQAA